MIQQLQRIVQLIESEWHNIHVLVVGDIMLDRYIWGDVERISPEAPVPVVRVDHQSEQPGGAGNVAMNLVGLGAKATLIGFRGDDRDGHALETSLQKAGVKPKTICVATHPTTSKLRIIGGKQQMIRLDTEMIDNYPVEAFTDLLSAIESTIPDVNVIIISDYAKGVVTQDVCRQIVRIARTLGIPVLVDPKQRNLERYRGATTICPNLSELSLSSGIPQRNIDRLLAAAQRMVVDLELESITATMSEKGIALLTGNSKFIAPAVARQVFDVSGAGDTVIATLALALAGGLRMEVAVQLANVAAGIAVGKVGTAPVTRDELLISLKPEIALHADAKLLTLDGLRERASAWRLAGQRIVFTNGCFDLLHIGHITLLEHARREGDQLVVAINSDSSVRSLKGPSRPIVSERERGRILAALSAVDAVIVFSEQTPLRIIEELRPDVIVKGGDYHENAVVGAKEVRSWGGRVKIIPTVEGFSTTNLIAKAVSPVVS